MLLTERAATILNSVLMDFSPCFNASQTSLFLRNLHAPDGRKSCGFQLRTEIYVLRVLQLGLLYRRKDFGVRTVFNPPMKEVMTANERQPKPHRITSSFCRRYLFAFGKFQHTPGLLTRDFRQGQRERVALVGLAGQAGAVAGYFKILAGQLLRIPVGQLVGTGG